MKKILLVMLVLVMITGCGGGEGGVIRDPNEIKLSFREINPSESLVYSNTEISEDDYTGIKSFKNIDGYTVLVFSKDDEYYHAGVMLNGVLYELHRLFLVEDSRDALDSVTILKFDNVLGAESGFWIKWLDSESESAVERIVYYGTDTGEPVFLAALEDYWNEIILGEDKTRSIISSSRLYVYNGENRLRADLINDVIESGIFNETENMEGFDVAYLLPSDVFIVRFESNEYRFNLVDGWFVPVSE